MWLRVLRADRLRNLRAVSVRLSAGLNLVTGRNGQGKTSLLEAAYLLGTGHSFRTRRIEEVVEWGGGPLRVSGEIATRSGDAALSVVVNEGQRRLLVDNRERGLEEYLGRLDVVAVSGEGMRTLRDGPEGRRRFLDSGIAGLRPSFLRVLGEYRRILAERNALLRATSPFGSPSRRGEIEAWNERLTQAAARLHRERRAYAVRLASCLGPAEEGLFPDGEHLQVTYRPSPAPAADAEPSDFEEIFRQSLERNRMRDQALGFTAEGPHRDDVRMGLEGVDLRRYGSAGQVRAAMVALCVGKLAILRDERLEAPLFLMDDFDSDLDERRASSLTAFLQDGGFQAVLASSKEGFVASLGVPFRKIRLEGGSAEEP